MQPYHDLAHRNRKDEIWEHIPLLVGAQFGKKVKEFKNLKAEANGLKKQTNLIRMAVIGPSVSAKKILIEIG
jgi:hypothetical protein